MEPFYYDGFEPADDVRAKAEALLKKIRLAAPPSARVTGNLELDGELYHCGIEIGSLPLPFAVSMAARFPGVALDRAEFAILRKLGTWARASAAETSAAS